MVIDTLASVAIFLGKPNGERFEAISSATIRFLPVACLFEARRVLVTRRDGRSVKDLDLWLFKAEVDTVPADSELVGIATQAWLAFGKGWHPASLNFADCRSHALARRSELPLLFKGKRPFVDRTPAG